MEIIVETSFIQFSQVIERFHGKIFHLVPHALACKWHQIPLADPTLERTGSYDEQGIRPAEAVITVAYDSAGEVISPGLPGPEAP